MLYRSAKKICLSFDDDNDRHYRDLLSVLVAHPGPNLDFEDLTPGAIDPNRVDRVKGVLTTQIRAATHMLVLVGAYANATHKDSQLIGTRNWQWWEIDQAKVEGKRLIAVKIKYPNPTPDPLLNAGAKWATSFTVESIRTAIDEA